MPGPMLNAASVYAGALICLVLTAVGGCAAVATSMGVAAVQSTAMEAYNASASSPARERELADQQGRGWSILNEPGGPAVLSRPELRVLIIPHPPARGSAGGRFMLAIHIRSQQPGYALKPGSVLLRMEAAHSLPPALVAQPANDAVCLGPASARGSGEAFAQAPEAGVPLRETGHCFELVYPTPAPAVGQRFSVHVRGLTRANADVPVPEVEFLNMSM